MICKIIVSLELRTGLYWGANCLLNESSILLESAKIAAMVGMFLSLKETLILSIGIVLVLSYVLIIVLR